MPCPWHSLQWLMPSYSPDINSRIQPLIPALKSNWLISHVITCFFGYAAFGLSFGLSLMYLIKRLQGWDRDNSFLRLIPGLGILDELNYQIVAIGFFMLTLGIITGSVWGTFRLGQLLELGPQGDMVPLSPGWSMHPSFISRLVRWLGR